MDILDLAVAVLIGNTLTVILVWGFKTFDRQEKDGDIKVLTYGAAIVPLALVIITLWVKS